MLPTPAAAADGGGDDGESQPPRSFFEADSDDSNDVLEGGTTWNAVVQEAPDTASTSPKTFILFLCVELFLLRLARPPVSCQITCSYTRKKTSQTPHPRGPAHVTTGVPHKTKRPHTSGRTSYFDPRKDPFFAVMFAVWFIWHTSYDSMFFSP